MTGADAARYHHRRPFPRDFYDAVRAALAGLVPEPLDEGVIDAAGRVVGLDAADVLRIQLLDGPQIVHLFAWNRDDPDERIWTNETSSKENAFLVTDHRIWSTMARFRPILTVIEDSVRAVDAPGRPLGRHHFVLGGFETPAAWLAGGGDPGVPSVWQRMRELLDRCGVDPNLYRDHISLFQKVAVDVPSQRFEIVTSDAGAGDFVTLFAEIPLQVALVPSPYRDGGTSPAALDGSVGRVRFERRHVPVDPMPWPYAGVPYPDLTAYGTADGRRD